MKPVGRRRSIGELLRSPKGLEPYQIGFLLPLLDLSQLSDEEIAGEPVLRSTLGLLKYSRSKQLAEKLGELLRLIAQSLPQDRLPEWIQAIRVYIMSVNKNIDSQQYKQTLESVFPTQFEPGSLADRLLIQGREEGLERGKLAGKIQLIQELLGDTTTPESELNECAIETLTTKLVDLQKRIRDRDI